MEEKLKIIEELIKKEFPIKCEIIYQALQKEFAMGGQQTIKDAIFGALVSGAKALAEKEIQK